MGCFVECFLSSGCGVGDELFVVDCGDRSCEGVIVGVVGGDVGKRCSNESGVGEWVGRGIGRDGGSGRYGRIGV